MTEKLGQVVVAAIIPYQELLGNYDQRYKPYREKALLLQVRKRKTENRLHQKGGKKGLDRKSGGRAYHANDI